MMVYGIPSYKLEKDVVEAEIDVLRAMGVEIRCGIEVGTDVNTVEEATRSGSYLAEALAALLRT